MSRLLNWYGPITETPSQGSQTPDPDGGFLEQRQHTFRAEFDEPVSDDVIYALNQMPKFFENMVFKVGSVSPNLFVVGRAIRQNGDVPNAYDITIDYANKWINNQNPDKPNVQLQWIVNPLARPALIEWGSYITREAVERDEDDNAVTTTAGEPLVLEEERHHRKLTITKNVKLVTKIFAEGEYINEEDTTIGGHLFKKLTLWLLPIQIGHISYENGIFYYSITMTILHNPKTWIRQIRNAGYYMKSFTAKKIPVVTARPGQGAAGIPNVTFKDEFPLEPIIFSDGRKADRPVLLDEEGRPLQARVTGVGPNPQNPSNIPGQGPLVFTYEILAPDKAKPFTKDQLEKATRYFRTKKKLNFTKNLPLT